MWRLMTATFAFLGWSFYTLSGGADYQPREGSRQAEALRQNAETGTPTSADAILAQDKIDTLVLGSVSMNSSDLPPSGIGGLPEEMDARPISVSADAQSDNVIRWTATLNLAKPAQLQPPAQSAVITEASAPTNTNPVRSVEIRQADLRKISGSNVNYRTGPGTKFGVLGKLPRSTKIEVLESFDNGWLRIRVVDSNRVGWVSGALVSR
jgi:hypothetical protein